MVSYRIILYYTYTVHVTWFRYKVPMPARVYFRQNTAVL